MRAKIRLDGRKNSLTNSGYPIIIYLTKDSKEKLIRTGYHAKKQDWDPANALPKKSHPEYSQLLNYLEKKKLQVSRLLARSRIEPISLSKAERELSGMQSDVFYKEGIVVAEKQSKRTYKIALESFNSMYPNILFREITPKIVRDYMNTLLATPVNGRPRSPNGVISYLTTLTALWNKLDRPNNPFSGIRPQARRTKNKSLSDSDMRKLMDHPYKPHPNSKGGGKANYINYLLLCFYLGGIDMGDLARLRYDKNVVEGRIEFNRGKGGTEVRVSNKIFPEAWEILDRYDCRPYLTPLGKMKYSNFIPNMSRYLKDIKDDLGLSKIPYSKAGRYTFITRAQMLMIDERVCEEIVGHARIRMHSVYMDEYPAHVRDNAHKKIIDLR